MAIGEWYITYTAPGNHTYKLYPHFNRVTELKFKVTGADIYKLDGTFKGFWPADTMPKVVKDELLYWLVEEVIGLQRQRSKRVR